MSKSALVRAFRPCARRACLRGGRTQPTMLRHDDSPPCPLRLILQLARATPEPARPTTCCEPSVRACPRAPLLTRPRPVGAQIFFALLGPATAVLTNSFVTGMMSRQILRRQIWAPPRFDLKPALDSQAMDTKPVESTQPAASAAAATDKKLVESPAASAAAATDKESKEAAAVVSTKDKHAGEVKPNKSRLLSPMKKKASFAAAGAKIFDHDVRSMFAFGPPTAHTSAGPLGGPLGGARSPQHTASLFI